MRSFLWDMSLIQVNPNGNIFQKIIPHILSNLSPEITWSWNWDFLTLRSWDNFSLKSMCKTNEVNILLKEIEQGKQEITIISGEIWSSHPEFWKIDVLKNFGKLLKNCPWQSNCNHVEDT